MASVTARAAYSYTETADLLGISEATCRLLVDNGVLTAVPLSERVRRIPAWSIAQALGSDVLSLAHDFELAMVEPNPAPAPPARPDAGLGPILVRRSSR